MTVEVIPFEPHHVVLIKLQPAQAYLEHLLSIDYGISLYQGGPAFTLWDSGRVLAIAGTTRMWAGHALAWALLSQQVGPHMTRLTRAVRRFLDTANDERIAMSVDIDNPEQARWARLLGFEFECRARKFYPGRDMDIFVRVR